MKYQIGVIGSSAERNEGDNKAKAIGREIAKSGNTLITGGCGGLPYQAIRGAKEGGGLTVGVSPAQTREEHVEEYGYPVGGHDTIIYTGFGYKGRNVILVRSCDGVIATAGQMGTLNELTIAFSEEKPIGLLEGVSGAAEEFEELAERIGRPERTVFRSGDPKELVDRIVREIDRKS